MGELRWALVHTLAHVAPLIPLLEFAFTSLPACLPATLPDCLPPCLTACLTPCIPA
jgi:hypothetical protein